MSTKNSKIINIIDEQGNPKLNISDMFLCDIDSYTKISDSLRNQYANIDITKPVFLGDTDGYKHLTSLTSPTRYDALTSLNPDSSYVYPDLYTLEVISSDVTELGYGHYKIDYDFTIGVAKKVKLFVYDDAAGEMFEEDEFDNLIVIDYDNMNELDDKINRFQFDDVNSRLYCLFNNGEGLFEIPISKVASIPNEVINENISISAYLKNMEMQNDNYRNTFTQNRLLNQQLMIKQQDKALVEALLSDAQQSSYQSTTWGYDNNYVKLSDNITNAKFTITALSTTALCDDITNVSKDDVLLFTGLPNSLFKISSVNMYAKIPVTDYSLYLAGESKQGISIYLKDSDNTYKELTGLTTPTRQYALTNVYYQPNLYYKEINNSITLTNTSTLSLTNVTAKKLNSLQNKVYSGIITLWQGSVISNISDLLKSDIPSTIEYIKSLIVKLNNDISSITSNIKNSSRIITKMTIEDINKKLIVNVKWDEPPLVDNEVIKSYNIAYFTINKSYIDLVTSEINKITSSSNDLVLTLRDKIINTILLEKYLNVNVKEASLNVINAKLTRAIKDSYEITTDTGIFNADDANVNKPPKVIIINNEQYLISQYKNNNQVILNKPLSNTYTNYSVMKRNQYPSYENPSVISNNELTLENIGVDDYIVLFIRAVTEFDLPSAWSIPKLIKLSDVNYKNVNKNIISYIQEDLHIIIDYGISSVDKPTPPTLNEDDFTYYDSTSVILSGNKLLDAKRKRLSDIDSELSSVKDKINTLGVNTTLTDDQKKEKENNYRFGNDSETYIDNNSAVKKSLKSLLRESIQIKKDIKQYEVPNQFKKYHILIEFNDYNENSNVKIVKYVLSYKIKGNNNLKIANTIIESPLLPVKDIDPLTGSPIYEDSSYIRKFDVEVYPDVDYVFKIAAITSQSVQSDWSNEITFKVTSDDTSISNNDIVTIDSLIADNVEYNMLGHIAELDGLKKQFESIKVDLDNKISVVNTNVSSIKTELTGNMDKTIGEKVSQSIQNNSIIQGLVQRSV